MNRVPLLARMLACAARGVASHATSEWVEAMVADLDEAAEDGCAVRWSVGCFVNALRFRFVHRDQTTQRSVVAPVQGVLHNRLCALNESQTRQEQSRRTFMANAVVAFGGAISFGLAIPLVTSLTPAIGATEDEWSPLSDQQWRKLQALTDRPAKVSLYVRDTDGYLPTTDAAEFMWAVKMSSKQLARDRPELIEGPTNVPYPIANLGFALFSSICPHLGGRYEWIEEQQQFVCPVHGSAFTRAGARVAGPAQRGLDPLPSREIHGKAEVTWIEYQGNTPAHIVLKIG